MSQLSLSWRLCAVLMLMTLWLGWLDLRVSALEHLLFHANPVRLLRV